MTTSVKVQSHNYPVLVRITDRSRTTHANASSGGRPVTLHEDAVRITEQVLWPEDGEQFFHSTTTRTIECVDLEYDDPRAVRRQAGEQK